MTQAFDDQEDLTPVTVIEVQPCPIVQVKNEDSDGYTALKLGFDPISENLMNQPDQGAFEKAKVPSHRRLREFRVDDVSEHSVGDLVHVDIFEPGELVDVTGKSRGKGFQGTVKRHGFAGGPKTHGQSDRHRAPGSIGQSSYPSRVFKGTRMSGHMGDRQVTVKGLKVIRVDKDRNLLAVKGAVPGSRGTMVIIKKR